MTNEVPDALLLASADIARQALREITPARTIGEPAGYIVHKDGVVSLLFECALAGYPGWHWTVSLARSADEHEASVLEAELLPGERALLAPNWVPWAERLAEQSADEDEDTDDDDTDDDTDTDDDDDDDDLDDDDLDDDDLDDDDLDDDIDGVDLDALNEDDEDDEDR